MASGAATATAPRTRAVRCVDGPALSGLLDVDLATNEVRALAGTSLDDLMRWLVPLGMFVPVTPGTRMVTVGGAIAADVHGKNHHVKGSFANHVASFRMIDGRGELRDISPVSEPEVFWATAGGMGLTGVIVDATIRMTPIEASLLERGHRPDVGPRRGHGDDGRGRRPLRVLGGVDGPGREGKAPRSIDPRPRPVRHP